MNLAMKLLNFSGAAEKVGNLHTNIITAKFIGTYSVLDWFVSGITGYIHSGF